MNDNLKLWYLEPAKEWVEALPLGNGRLGAMVFGDVLKERIQINEDTLWAGIPKEKEVTGEKINDLEKTRKLIFEEKYVEAQELVNNKLLGSWNESYAPMGNLYLDFGENLKYKEYSRELNLDDATTVVKYKINNTQYKRTIFISRPDDILIIKIEKIGDEKISFNATFDSLLKYNVYSENNISISLKGKAPVHALPSYEVSEHPIVYDEKKGMNFKAVLTAKLLNGNIKSNNGELIIEGSDEVILTMSSYTSFNGFETESGTNGKDIDKLCDDNINNICNKSFDEMYNSHFKEYNELFSRLKLNIYSNLDKADIENSSKFDMPTNVRLNNIKCGKQDISMIPLYFQYGRYLLISSSRKGTQPANLQGIWNEDLRPAWSSNYTTNINVEMNYWPAEICNLSECHEPLFKMIKEVSEVGKETAKIRYGCNGWTANHNIDLWRQAAPAGGSAEWAYWPMAAGWLCSHILEHYAFTLDSNFLKEMYPIMKGAAEFLLDWLVEDKEGNLVTCPSLSPENDFLTKDGNKCCLSMASTMDMAIIRNLFDNCIKAINILCIDYDFKDKLESAKDKLYPYKIGKYGQLQEWFKDFEEYEVGHRHLSHLFGLYPGNEINEEHRKDLLEPCRVSLERRLNNGGGHTGWSCAWIICLYARLKDSYHAEKYLNLLLKQLTFSNLFNVCPPFQIDGNFGGTAAIGEMLIQSHNSFIELLPALPKDWENGEVIGIKARGGFEVSMSWKNYILEYIEIKSLSDCICKLRYSGFNNKKIQNEIVIYHNNDILEFKALKNKTYKLNLFDKILDLR